MHTTYMAHSLIDYVSSYEEIINWLHDNLGGLGLKMIWPFVGYSNTILVSSRTTPSHLGDQILKSNKHNWNRRERGWSALAWIGWLTQRGAQIFSQEQGFKTWILVREEYELKVWISREALLFLSGPWLKGVGGGLFIILNSKRVVGRVFTRLV
jgi:hypothetical protein